MISDISNFHYIRIINLPLILCRLESCKSMGELKQIHASVLKSRPLQTHLVFSKLLHFCALSSAGDLRYAHALFRSIQVRSLYIYNTIIRGFSRSRSSSAGSLFFYREMLDNGFLPDKFTLPFILKACVQLEVLGGGRALHVHAIRTALEYDIYVKNTLMRLYAVCGLMEEAHKLFEGIPQRDLVSWTTLISGYARMGESGEAIRLFQEMGIANLKADEMIIAVVLSACASLGDLDLGRKIHGYITDNKVHLDVFVGNALVDMYLKCGDFDLARKIFEEMPQRNVVSWNSIILGLVFQGDFKEALAMFRAMLEEGFESDNVTLVGVLNCCANLGALELGEWVHLYIERNQFKAEGFVGNALVDMYSKCGSIYQALEVFSYMSCKDVCTYTAMIAGFAMNGQAEKALSLFSDMSRVGIRPDEVTFTAVLSACSHVGLVDEGRRHFQDMCRLYDLRPQIEHYVCMVDLLGRAGYVEEAEEFIRSMPIQPDAVIWGALLGACRIHGRVDLGKRIVKCLLELEPERDGAYVLMSNLYAFAGQWRDASKLRREMKLRRVTKIPGCSMIELDGVVYEFQMADKSHQRAKEIYLMLDEIIHVLKGEGYEARTLDVFLDIAVEEK